MKKYFITAVAALSLGGLFTSCTHDVDGSSSSGDVAQNAQESYEQAFLNTFGRPVEGFDWGFGSSSATTASTRGTRVFDDKPTQPSFSSKPSMPTTYKNTLSEAKTISGITNLLDGITSGGTYYVDDDDETKPWNNNDPWKVDIQSTSLTIYFDGIITFGGNNYQENDGATFCVTEGSTLKLKSVRNGLKVYLAERATLDLTDIDWCTFQNNNAAVYMCSGSKINANYLKFVNKLTILNDGGTINAKYLEVNKSFLYNNGTLKVESTGNGDNDGKIIIMNSEGNFGDNQYKSELVNNGTLIGKSLYLEGNSRFYNTLHSSTRISGHSDIKNGDDCWMNDGSYETGSFTIYGQAKHIYNNCKLKVNGEFKLWDSDSKFVLNGDASLICESFTWKTASFYMGSKSLLSVENAIYSENDVKEGRGFHGPSGNNPYAVIQAGSITKSGDNQHSMAYYGNLYIDTQNHFEQGAKDPMNATPSQPYYYYDSSVKFSFTDAKDPKVVATESPVSIPNSDCSPGYNTTVTPPDNPVTPTTDKVRVIAEDLTTLDGKADFDFNDVVFDVDLLSNNQVRITLLAAGGTLPLTVGDQGQQESGDYEPTMEMQKDSQGQDMESVMKYEIHRLFKVATTTMVNTNAAGGANRDAVEVIIDNPSTSSDIHEIANAIPIRVYKKGTWIELEKAVPVGTRSDKLTASKVAVDGTFQWCAERVSINKDSRYQYSDYKGTQKSRFELYLDGKLGAKWWDQSTVATD